MVLVVRLVAFLQLHERARTEDGNLKIVLHFGVIGEVDPEIAIMNKDCIQTFQLLLDVFLQYILELLHQYHFIDASFLPSSFSLRPLS